MLNATDNDCSKSATVSASNAVLNSSASSVCVSVKQRSSAADCCGVRCKSRAIVAQTAGIVGFMVGNIAHCKITPTLSACIAQMVGTLKTQCSTVCRHYPTLRTSCCRILGPLDVVVAHLVFRLMQSVATLRQSRHAKELQIRLVRFDSGPRLQTCTQRHLAQVRRARVVKLVDTSDLKSAASRNGAYRFDSGLGHHLTSRRSMSSPMP